MQARNDLLAFTEFTMPGFQRARHHRLICDKLNGVLRGEITRLMIMTPPRHTKSELVSTRLPALYLGQNPTDQIIAASYGADLAHGFGRKVRNLIGDREFRLLFPHVKIAADSAAKDNWHLEMGGAYVAAGVGGGITGKGANLCVRHGSEVITPSGRKKIENVTIGEEVLSYDFSRDCPKFSRVSSVSWRNSDERNRVYTRFGHLVETTPEHLFYANDCWRPAQTLTQGDKLVRCLPNIISPSPRGDVESGAKWQDNSVLLNALHGTAHECRPRQFSLQDMSKLREVSSSEKGGGIGSILQQGLQERASEEDEAKPHSLSPMRDMQFTLPAEEHSPTWEVLLQGVQRFGTLPRYSEGEEPRMEAWAKSSPIHRTLIARLSGCETEDNEARQVSLCGVLCEGETASSSHRHGRIEQSSSEPCDDLQGLSSSISCRGAFYSKEDFVAVVERVCEPAPVYDITVEGTHCFFANDILIHNCIIDDPIKGRADAESVTIRDKVWDWYRGDLRPRLMPDAAIVLVQTRWHPDDLAGRIIDAMHSGGEQWEIVNLPALATSPFDPLGRKLGEALWPEWYDEAALEAIHSSLGERDWMSLYQQEPKSGTEFFSDSMFLVETPAGPAPIAWPQAVKFVFATVDTTQKGGKGRDGTAVSYWAHQELKIPGQYELMLLDWDIVEHEGGLLDIWFPQVFARLEELARSTKARVGTIGAMVEDKAAGSILLQQAPRHKWPMHPIDSKLTSVGKDARAINASGYINAGRVKITEPAYSKRMPFRGAIRNHWLHQMSSYRVGDTEGKEDDLFDTGTYGIALALGNSEGF